MHQRFEWNRTALAIVLLALPVFASACNGTSSLIDKVVFTPSDNLESIRVALVFTDNVQSELSGEYQILNYGQLFLDPYTASSPFEVGFALDTSIVNDQNYIHLAPTTVLPNGVPIGIPNTVVEIHAENPISSSFDIFGYIDILHGQWMGVAAMFNFMNDQYFPDGLSINEVFFRDTAGNPGVIASVFGPTVENGVITRSGGIAMFANVKQLMAQGMLKPNQDLVLRAEPGVSTAGPTAPRFNADDRNLRRIERNLIDGFNGR